jgi:hypothetical protein
MDLNEESIKKLKVNQLKDELRKVNKAIYGTKTVLIQRLLNYKKELTEMALVDQSNQAVTVILDSSSVNDIIHSTPSSSQTFSYELRLENAIISDIEEDVVNEKNKEDKERKKRKF